MIGVDIEIGMDIILWESLVILEGLKMNKMQLSTKQSMQSKKIESNFVNKLACMMS